MDSKKWVFMTGISDGVGKYTALKLSEQGYQVIGICRSKPDYIDIKPNIYWFPFDLSKPFKKDEIIEQVRKLTDTVHVIIMNAANACYGELLSQTHEQIEETINVNLLSTIYLLQSLLPMTAKGGQVIFIGSSAEYLPGPKNGVYGMTKAALNHLTLTMNVECVHEKIRFKILKPGFINTDFGLKSGEPINKANQKMGLKPEIVADEIVALLKKNKIIHHAGWISCIMWVLNKMGSRIVLWLSMKRHANKIRKIEELTKC